MAHQIPQPPEKARRLSEQNAGYVYAVNDVTHGPSGAIPRAFQDDAENGLNEQWVLLNGNVINYRSPICETCQRNGNGPRGLGNLAECPEQTILDLT